MVLVGFRVGGQLVEIARIVVLQKIAESIAVDLYRRR